MKNSRLKKIPKQFFCNINSDVATAIVGILLFCSMYFYFGLIFALETNTPFQILSVFSFLVLVLALLLIDNFVDIEDIKRPENEHRVQKRFYSTLCFLIQPVLGLLILIVIFSFKKSQKT